MTVVSGFAIGSEYFYSPTKSLFQLKTTIALLCTLLTCTAFSQEKGFQKGLYGSFGMGAGYLDRNFGDLTNPSVRLCMHLAGGWFIVKPVQVGFTFGGWTLKPANYNNPEKYGHFISTDYLHLQLYPWKGQRLYLKTGYGICKYINVKDMLAEANGTTLLLSAGYELRVRKIEKSFAGIEFTYQSGRIDNKEFLNVQYVNRRFHGFDVTLHFALD